MDRAAWWCLVVLLMMFGCTDRAAPPLALEIEEAASAEEAETVLAAAEEWNKRVGRELFYVAEHTDEEACDRVVVRFVDVMPPEYDEYSGLFQQVGCHYQIWILHDFGHDRANAVHELGHTLELGHSKDKNSVMFWSTRSSAIITEEDVMRVRARWAL